MTPTEFKALQQSVQHNGPVADRLRIVMHVLLKVLGFAPTDGLVLAFQSYFGENLDIESILQLKSCLLYTSPSPRDGATSRMPSSA